DREDADDGAGDRELAAHERGAAEHDREDRVQLDVETGRVGVGGHRVGAVEDAGEARQHAAGRIRAPDDAARAHARQAARLGVDADGLGEHPECRATLDERHERDRRHRDEECERQADDVALRHELVGRRVDRRDEAARDQQRDAAPGEHEHERRDDRLNPDHRHQESVPGAEQHADQHRDADRTEHRAQVVGSRRAVDDGERDGARDGHDGADGEVDAARRDHDHHAERDEHERGAVAQDVDQRAVELVALDRHAHEARAGDRVDDDERHERRDRQHEAVGEDLLHAALSGLSGWGCSSAMKATRSSTPMSCEVSSPILRRSRITTMRWAMRMTSSSSEEMKTTARPCSESSATLRWMSALAPTSMPRVGSSRMMSCGAVASQRARSTFCWLPPERLRTSAFGFAGRTPRARMYSSTMVSCSYLRTLRIAPRLAWMPSTMFSATVRSPTSPSARRSSEEKAMRRSIAWRG